MSDKVPHPKTVEQVESIDESGSPLVEDAPRGSGGDGGPAGGNAPAGPGDGSREAGRE